MNMKKSILVLLSILLLSFSGLKELTLAVHQLVIFIQAMP
jgi:hypothetical protein